MSLLERILKISFGASYQVDEGIRNIKKEIRSSKKVILNNIPLSLVQELLPLLKDKKVSISLKEAEFDQSIGDEIGGISYHDADIQAGYGEENMHFGCIVLPKMIFDVIWNEDGIQDIAGIKTSSCLKCDLRVNLCNNVEEYGETVCVGTVFNAEEGIRHIKENLKKSSKAIINYLPDYLIEELLPYFKGKKIHIMMPYGHRIHADVRNIPQSRVARKLIKPQLKIHDHHDVMGGGICLPHIHYGIAWKDDKILEIRSLEVEECVHCMVKKHLFAWSFGKRISS
jgi:hypothetical protein